MLNESRPFLALVESRSCASPSNEPVSGPAEAGRTFDALYARFARVVRGWVEGLGGREADREDLVQEVFVAAFRGMARFDGRDPVAWLYQITRRTVRDHRRSVWSQRYFGASRQRVEGWRLVSDVTPFSDLQSKQRAALLGRLLRTLTERDATALVMFEVDGEPGAELAARLGVSTNNLWVRLHKARQKLKRRILGSPTTRANLGLGASDSLLSGFAARGSAR